MKVLALCIAACAIIGGTAYARGTSMVRGHVRSDGVYVAPHVRTNPNSTKLDNWSTQGNYNPYNGKVGTIDPYKPSSSNPNGAPSNPARRSSYGY